MLAQQLDPDYYNWNGSKYNDNEIIKNASKYDNSRYSDKGNKYHYLYVIYHDYYDPLINEFQHPFNDYGYIFSKDLSHKVRAKLIQMHIVIRLNYFYFMDTLGNEKYSKGKHGQTNVVPPIIASIMHDKDMKPILNRDKSVSKVTVEPHLHFVFKFKKRVTPKQLSKWCGVEPQYFESSGQGRYALDNMMAYLIHAKQPSKHLYNYNDVWSNKPIFDYQQYYLNHKDKWKDHRASQITQKHTAGVDWLVQQVQHGSLSKQDILLNPKYRYIYADNMKKINDAVQFHAELEGELTYLALQKREFNLSVFYIWGKSGSGKTFTALSLANRIAKRYKWRVYQGASTNSLDDYSGEQVVLLDDVRSTTMGASDWLKLLDPINMSPNSARYHNRRVAARVIIMTNPEPPAQFFGYMKNVHGDEPLSQFIRRLTTIAQVICTDKNKHQVLLSNVRKLKKPYPIKIGMDYSPSGDNDRPITRKTRYVADPTQLNHALAYDKSIPEDKALNYLTNEVAKNNNPNKKHPVKDKQIMSLKKYLSGVNYVHFNKQNYKDLPF